jgi:hypothetical protein
MSKQIRRGMAVFALVNPNTLAMLSAGALLVGTVTANASPVDPYVVTLEQQGLNVVVTGAGEFDLTGLTSAGLSASLVPEIDAPLPRIVTGVGGQMDLYTGATGPNSFGTGSEHIADSASGDSVGVSDPSPTHYILVPQGYASGTALSESRRRFPRHFRSLLAASARSDYLVGGVSVEFTRPSARSHSSGH